MLTLINNKSIQRKILVSDHRVGFVYVYTDNSVLSTWELLAARREREWEREREWVGSTADGTCRDRVRRRGPGVVPELEGGAR